MDGNNSVDSNNEPRALMGEREREKKWRGRNIRGKREKNGRTKRQRYFFEVQNSSNFFFRYSSFVRNLIFLITNNFYLCFVRKRKMKEKKNSKKFDRSISRVRGK